MNRGHSGGGARRSLTCWMHPTGPSTECVSMVVSESPSRPDDGELAGLRELELAPRYRAYPLEELAVQALVLVARPARGLVRN